MATEVAPDARRKIEDAICAHAGMLTHGSAEMRQGALDTILAIAAPLLRVSPVTDAPVVTDAAIDAGAHAIHDVSGVAPPACCEDSHREHRERMEGDRALAELVLHAAAPILAYAAGQAAGDRIMALEQLAAEMLASYSKTSDGYRGRVGQVKIAEWRGQLAGTT